MTSTSPHVPHESALPQFVSDEAARDQARADAHAKEAKRYKGVAWSGLGPDPWRPRPAPLLEADANERLKAFHAWRASRLGRFVTSVARAQRAAAAAHFAGEAARAASSRGFEAELERCSAAVKSMEAEARALLAAARQARRALARGLG